MFEGFTFACASRQHAFCHPYSMEDSVSPTSSRESTPCYDTAYTASPERGYPINTSIAELSRHFDQHSLTPPRRPLVRVEGATPRTRELSPPHHSPTSFASRICRRRQSLNRLQCSSDHLSRISALVEQMVHTGQPLYDSSPHPTSLLDDSLSPSLSPDEIPPMVPPMVSPLASSYFDLPSPRPSSASFSANRDPRLAQHPSRNLRPYKIDKDLRHSASRDRVGKPMVKKQIRVRKSLKMLESGAKRCER